MGAEGCCSAEENNTIVFLEVERKRVGNRETRRAHFSYPNFTPGYS